MSYEYGYGTREVRYSKKDIKKLLDTATTLSDLASSLKTMNVDVDFHPVIKQITQAANARLDKMESLLVPLVRDDVEAVEIEFSEADKLRMQKLSGILDQKKERERAEQEALKAKTRAREIGTQFFIDVGGEYKPEKVVRIVEEFRTKLAEEASKDLNAMFEQERERRKLMEDMVREMSPDYDSPSDLLAQCGTYENKDK